MVAPWLHRCDLTMPCHDPVIGQVTTRHHQTGQSAGAACLAAPAMALKNSRLALALLGKWRGDVSVTKMGNTLDFACFSIMPLLFQIATEMTEIKSFEIFDSSPGIWPVRFSKL